MAFNAWTLAALDINGTTFPQVANQSLDPSIDLFINRAGGSADVSYIATRQTVPRMAFDLTSIKSVLDVTAFGVVAVGTTVDQYWSHLAAGGFRTTGHVKTTINDGIIIPRRLSVSHPNEAMISLEVIATYDGTNNPFTYTGSASLPANGLAATEKYTLGGLKLSSTIYQIQGFDIDFGITEFVQGYNGEAFARYVAGMTREIRINVATHDLSLINTVGVLGAYQTNAVLFLRKVTEGGTREVETPGDAHISITMPQAMVYPGPAQAAHNAPATASIMICVNDDGTNAPITLDTTANIA